MKLKRWITLGFAVLLTVYQPFLALIGGAPAVTQAATINRDVYQDPDTGDLLFKSIVSEEDEQFGYELLGFTLHRSTDGYERLDQYVTLPFDPADDSTTTYTEGPFKIEIRRILKSDITSAIRSYNSEWYDEWMSGKPGKIWCNGILTTYTGTKSGGRKYAGSLSANGTFKGKVYDFGSGRKSTDGVKAGSKEDLQTEYSWTGSRMNDISAFFHKQFFYNLDGEKDSEEDISYYVTTNGTDEPKLYTWHMGQLGTDGKPEYNVGEAIPAGKVMRNGFLASRAYGSWSYEKIKPITRTYTVSFDVSGHYYMQQTVTDLDTGESLTVPYFDQWTETVNVDVKRSASYYAIRNVNIYELNKVIIHNGAYDVAEYDMEEDSIYGNSSILINGEEPGAYLTIYPSDPDKHISWPEEVEGTVPRTYNENVPQPSDTEITSKLYLQLEAERLVGDVTSWNDKLVIDGVDYLDDTAVTGEHTENLAIAPDGPEEQDFGWVSDSKEVGIPISTKNGSYSTTADAQYVRIFPSDRNLQTAELSGKDAILPDDLIDEIEDEDDRPLTGMAKNEPVVVHTPVVAPISFRDTDGNELEADEQSQIWTGDDTPAWNEKLTEQGIKSYDLVLDNTYTLSFDPYEWLSAKVREEMEYEETTNGNVVMKKKPDGISGYPVTGFGEDTYDEFISKREVRFPFSVAVKESGSGEMIFHEPDEFGSTKDGYTEFIELDNDEVEFYLPPWAVESYAKFGAGNQDSYYEVEFRVEARNFDGSGKTGELENKELDEYAASFTVPVSVAGLVYDFTVLGTNDRDMYEGYRKDRVMNADVAFAQTNEEKKAGTLNRQGEEVIKNISDGLIRSDVSDRDILPLRQGSSRVYAQMGAPWRGTTFAFSLRTMGTIGNLKNDGIEITPTFRYYDDNGVENEDVRIYYSRSDANGEQKFIEVGSKRDTLYGSMKLSDGMFAGAIDEDDALITARARSMSTTKELMNQSADVYSMSKISLKRDQMIYTGDSGDLALNSDKDVNSPDYTDYTSFTKNDGVRVSKAEIRRSVQTWYGEFTIPENLYICYKDIVINGVVCELGAKEGENGYQAAADIDHDGVCTLNDLALTGELSQSSGIWNVYDPDVNDNGIPDTEEALSGREADAARIQRIRSERKIRGGYLVVNFDITAKKSGKTVLSYGKSSLNMWTQQGAPTSTLLIQQTVKADSEVTQTSKIDLEDGDIAIVDLRYGLSDKKEAGVMMTK